MLLINNDISRYNAVLCDIEDNLASEQYCSVEWPIPELTLLDRMLFIYCCGELLGGYRVVLNIVSINLVSLCLRHAMSRYVTIPQFTTNSHAFPLGELPPISWNKRETLNGLRDAIRQLHMRDLAGPLKRAVATKIQSKSHNPRNREIEIHENDFVRNLLCGILSTIEDKVSLEGGISPYISPVANYISHLLASLLTELGNSKSLTLCHVLPFPL